MTDKLLNLMRREAERAGSRKAVTLMGKVTSYNPADYSAKVALQPEGQETGFLPIASPWVGDGWGLFSPPSPGDAVDVHFQEAGKGAPYISLRFYGDKARPLAVPSGEFWLVHKSGASFKFPNDGTTTFTDKSGASFKLNGDGTATLNANLIVNGTIRATGDIWDNYLTTGYTMASFRARYDLHTHLYDDGTTSVPSEIL